jgi:probable rRNA maturation factor
MILFDPDLEPAPALTAISAKRAAASAPGKSRKLPSSRTLARFLAEAQAAVRLKGEVTVLLTTDAAIRKLNREFRHKDKATDVLSFPAEGIGAEEIAGDLAISVPTALRQAVELDHALSTELKVLILHGLLHLAGYDHETDEGKMARRERLLRERLGLPQGLIERTAARKPAAVAGKASVLKGHGFSRAERHSDMSVALATGGRSLAKKVIRQGLKPKIHIGKQAARLKSCPFKAAVKARRP